MRALRMTVLVTVAMSLVTACGATSATSGTPSDAGGTSGSSCNDLGSAAQKDVSAVLEAHRTCTQASDCTGVELSASCFDSCSRAIRKDAAADLKAAQDKADQTQCAQFTSQGCKVTIPPCEPPSTPACVAGKCT
jgi:hypothetical protein